MPIYREVSMIGLPVEKIAFPRHLSAIVTLNQSGPEVRATMDVYSGWLLSEFEGGSTVTHENIASFLMVDSNTIRIYASETDLISIRTP
jgi:hypothetical protein